MKFSGFHFVSGTVFHIVSMVSITTGIEGYELISKSASHKKQSMFVNTMVCSTDTPDIVFDRVRTKQECILFCQGDDRCLSANWKNPSRCELFFFDPGTFANVMNCSYMIQGKQLLIDNLKYEDVFFHFYSGIE